jgi:hypothetical protein
MENIWARLSIVLFVPSMSRMWRNLGGENEGLKTVWLGKEHSIFQGGIDHPSSDYYV